MLFLVGLGGAGCKVIELVYKKSLIDGLKSRMSTTKEIQIRGVAVDTSEAINKLTSIPLNKRILVGKSLAKGHGAGSDMEFGKQLVTNECDLVMGILSNTDLGSADIIFLIAGLGGGTGTGGFSVLANKIKSIYPIPVIGVLILPSIREGNLYSKNAEIGFHEIKKVADGLIVIDNNTLYRLGGKNSNEYQVSNEAIIRFLSSIQWDVPFEFIKGKNSSIASMKIKSESVVLKDLIKNLIKNYLFVQLQENFESLYLVIYGNKSKIHGQSSAESWIREKYGAILICDYKPQFNSKFINCYGILSGIKGIEKRPAIEIKQKETTSEFQSLLNDINSI
jgi:hypothetical protein